MVKGECACKFHIVDFYSSAANNNNNNNNNGWLELLAITAEFLLFSDPDDMLTLILHKESALQNCDVTAQGTTSNNKSSSLAM